MSKEPFIVWTMAAAAKPITRGIRTNCTCPGAVQRAMLGKIEQTTSAVMIDIMAQPIGRRATVREQALPLLFLNSAAAASRRLPRRVHRGQLEPPEQPGRR